MKSARVFSGDALMKIEPLRDTFEEDKKNFPKDCVYEADMEAIRSLNKQIAARPEVWGNGLWPDDESERIAKCIAKECEELNPQILRAAFIPNDQLVMINAFTEDFDIGVVSDMLMAADNWFGCKITLDELGKREGITFGEFIGMIKERKASMPERFEEPRRKDDVSAEAIAQLEVYKKAGVARWLAPCLIFLILSSLMVYCICIRHPWGIVPALALCVIVLSWLYQKCARLAGRK